MVRGGSGRRPPRPPGRRKIPYGMSSLRQRRMEPRPDERARAARRAQVPFWRRLRQRIRAIWRWVVARRVRTWFEHRPTAGEVGQGGEVRQFPGR